MQRPKINLIHFHRLKDSKFVKNEQARQLHNEIQTLIDIMYVIQNLEKKYLSQQTSKKKKKNYSVRFDILYQGLFSPGVLYFRKSNFSGRWPNILHRFIFFVHAFPPLFFFYLTFFKVFFHNPRINHFGERKVTLVVLISRNKNNNHFLR